MYITGTVGDFMSRLHALPTGTNDLTNFITEGDGYLALNVSGVPIVTPQLSGMWEKEARLKYYMFTQSPSGLNQQQF